MLERDLVYAPEHGERGKLDLHLPDGPENCRAAGCRTVIVIHGGGLQALSKEGWTAWRRSWPSRGGRR